MKAFRILVLPKKSKFQWDCTRFRLKPRDMVAKYRKEGLNASRIVASHERQMRALKKVLNQFPEARVIPQDKISRKNLAGADLIISLGGDNHFQHVSHFAGNSVVAGVNSDPTLSEGSLTTFTPDQLAKVASRILEGRFGVEEWTRLQVTLNGKKLQDLALSEVFLGEAARCQMSRFRISGGGLSEVQKCSGLLVATGAGSSGWYDAAGRYLFAGGNRFPRTKKSFRFVTTEPFQGRLSKPSLLNGSVSRLKVRSLNDTHGVVVLDTQLEHPFPEGSEAVITLGKPLKVLAL